MGMEAGSYEGLWKNDWDDSLVGFLVAQPLHQRVVTEMCDESISSKDITSRPQAHVDMKWSSNLFIQYNVDMFNYIFI